MKNGLTKLLVIVFILYSNIALSQIVEGNVVDAKSGEPLVYVNIGVVGTSSGTITNLQGNFLLDVSNQSENLIIRFSMIGYVSKEFSINEMIDENFTIELKKSTTVLDDVIIKPKRLVEKQLGSKNDSDLIGIGWSGVGKGFESGTKIKVSKTIFIEDLNFYVSYNSFDSILLRLHIRNIADDMPGKELLKQNILIPVSIESGWVKVNLEDYDLYYDQDIIVSLEWLRAWGDYKGNFLLSMSLFKGILYSKRASEANWEIADKRSPGLYLNVLESK